MSALLSPCIETQVAKRPPPVVSLVHDPQADFLSIRGVKLSLHELVDPAFFSAERRHKLSEERRQAKPFPHLVIDGLFHPALLELVAEEFDLLENEKWAEVRSSYELFRRSGFNVRMGPATQLYFDVINSGWFGEWLSSITDVRYLLPDPKLFGGGLHESRRGATFAIHRDFNRHPHLGLKNEMVFITYLNKGWDPEWGSALELWDKKQCIRTVQPEFGRTVVLPHGPASYHGHPRPLQAPEERPRRSVAAYFYTSAPAGRQHGVEAGTVFMQKRPLDQAKAVARMVTPPVLWSLARKLVQR
jgi:hypothetical protein